MTDRPVDRSYFAETPKQARSVYDDWAQHYESDLCAMGYRIQAIIAAVGRQAKAGVFRSD